MSDEQVGRQYKPSEPWMPSRDELERMSLQELEVYVAMSRSRLTQLQRACDERGLERPE